MALISALAVPKQPCMDRLDAARALLGVSPASTVHEESLDSSQNSTEVVRTSAQSSGSRTRGGGLDALAALASKEVGMERSLQLHSFSSSDDDSEAMPPPPPRRGRVRSISNPEGMEKWDSLSRSRYERRHFVLPSSILEEELAEASAAAEAAKAEEEEFQMPDMYHQSSTLPLKKRSKASYSEPFGTSPNSVVSPINEVANAGSSPEESASPDEADLEPEELLRRARSRLLEDLSEGSLNGEKGGVTLPHSLSKYKQVYNKNGRIGIYTPAERAAIIARFNSKRTRRVWNKKIRYSCRKNLADRRLRVKGRFVKRSTEVTVKVVKSEEPPTEEVVQDTDMPDVNDPEAGFAPTEDQPFRRLRRHTIT